MNHAVKTLRLELQTQQRNERVEVDMLATSPLAAIPDRKRTMKRNLIATRRCIAELESAIMMLTPQRPAREVGHMDADKERP